MSEDHSIPVRFWIASETDKLVRRIAATEERSVSSVYRGLIHSGLQAAGYRGDGKTMEEQYKAALQETLKPYVEPLPFSWRPTTASRLCRSMPRRRMRR